MTQTDNYELIIVEGTDVVNPLVQFNPNFRKIDEVMKQNADAGVGLALETKSGINHAITVGDTPVFRFVATGDYRTGDTFSVNGDTVTVRCIDGSVPKDKAYVINQNVLCILTGTLLTLIGAVNEVGAVDVIYDNTNSGLTATDVQSAIDELVSIIGGLEARDIAYSNTVSGLSANTVQGAIDELNDKIGASDIVSVTADGVKTYAMLFNELAALINHSKVTHKTTLTIDSITNVLCYNIIQYTATTCTFGLSTLQTNNPLTSVAVIYNNSILREWNGTSVTDASSLVVPAGTIFTIHY